MNHHSGFDIKVSNLNKSFGNKKVLDNLVFNIKAGESCVILGQSGTGKSVLMRILGTLLDADSGSVKINEQEIVGISEKKKSKIMEDIGFLFQYSGLFEHLTIWENVAFREIYVKKMDKKKAKEIAINKLIEVGIKDIDYNIKPQNISGGMQRRVAMARTLMKEPKLILLDEPTSGLDPIMSDVINKLIISSKKILGTTMLTITHDLNSALQISDRIFVLHKSQLIWNGNSKDIFKVDHPYVKEFIKCTEMQH